LRELDEDVERVELGLRDLVVKRLENSRALWPQHLRDRLEGRIAGAIRKNPSLDPATFDTLDQAIQFADLSELFDAMVAKDVAGRFTDLGATPALQLKFVQLGDLRNSIRHSRAVSDVTRLEGQAAVHWFNSILSKNVG
jgi:hypothetical protein